MNSTPPWSRDAVHPAHQRDRRCSRRARTAAPQVWVRASRRGFRGRSAAVRRAAACDPVIVRSPSGSGRTRRPARAASAHRERGARDLLLRSGLQVLHRHRRRAAIRPRPARRRRRRRPCRPLHLRAQPAAGLEVGDHREARARSAARRSSRTSACAAASRVHRRARRTPAARRPPAVSAALLERQQRALEPDREAHARRRRAAHSRSARRSARRRPARLRAERAVVHLERGARVVVEPAHQAVIDLVTARRRVEPGLHRVEVRAALGAQRVEDRRACRRRSRGSCGTLQSSTRSGFFSKRTRQSAHIELDVRGAR